jgi:hypothetical protein
LNFRSLLFTCFLPVGLALAEAPDPIQLFSMEAYHGLGNAWLDTVDETPLLPAEVQARHSKAFREAYLGPWDPAWVVKGVDLGVLTLETRTLAAFRAELPAGKYRGMNHRPLDEAWIAKLARQLPADLCEPFTFRPGGCAMMLDNAAVRTLPTDEPVHEDHRIPGQGFPFDRLQNSAAWAGTPVHVLARTRDGAWTKVLTDSCAGWVRSRSLALAGDRFVRRWRKAVHRHGLTAILETAAPVTDARGTFRFHGYVGSVFPGQVSRDGDRTILIPGRNHRTQQARVERGRVPGSTTASQPWAYTPRNAASLWRSLLGRPYGWGNMHFHNDCSAELKSFLAPFGLWLPRNSSDQRRAGTVVDLSALDLAGRLEAVVKEGRPYRTLLCNNGHVMLYLGPVDGGVGHRERGLMTYQNMWGMRPKEKPDFRQIVGGSVLFPVLARYEGAPGLASQAGQDLFVMTHLDDLGTAGKI